MPFRTPYPFVPGLVVRDWHHRLQVLGRCAIETQIFEIKLFLGILAAEGPVNVGHRRIRERNLRLEFKSSILVHEGVLALVSGGREWHWINLVV